MTLEPAVHLIDLNFQGHPGHIAVAMLDSEEGPILVDPGPSVSLAVLQRDLEGRGVRLEDVSSVILTHIHLDHAGGVGFLAERNPNLRVHVHRAGVRHLLDPSRLMASATRLYGAHTETLWGAMNPVPAQAILPLDGGECITIGGRAILALATPGHAIHHMAFLDQTTGIAFVGDATGERFSDTDMVLPVTPPPDIDVEKMLHSTAAIRAWEPIRLFLTHFGLFDDVSRHLDDHDTRLRRWNARVVMESRGLEAEDGSLAQAFARDVLDEYWALLPGDRDVPIHPERVMSSWAGLARYHRKRTRDPG